MKQKILNYCISYSYEAIVKYRNASLFAPHKNTFSIISHSVIYILLIFFSLHAKANNDYTVVIDSDSVLPQIRSHGTNLLTCNYIFWEGQWKWQFFTKSTNISEKEYESKYFFPNIDLQIDTNTHFSTLDNATLSTIRITPKKDSSDNIKGGIICRLNYKVFKSLLGQPELLENQKGWSWGQGEDRITVKFDQPLAKLYFEPGSNFGEIRGFFFDEKFNPGEKTFQMTLSTGKKTKFAGTLDQEYSSYDKKSMLASPFIYKQDAVDLSFLNAKEKPAGKHGFVQATGDKFTFEDGTQGRFWGTNVNAYALFLTPKDQVKAHANRLSKLGFNLVRLHHHDSPWVTPNIFGKAPFNKTTSIDSISIDKLDWWVKCLKDEGIYVWLDLHVERSLTKEDGIEWIQELLKEKQQTSLKGYNYINPSIEEKMTAFNTAFLTHTNAYTGLAYKDDPAIMGILITNENDITNHFGNSLLPDKKVDVHSKHYMDKAKEFSRKWKLPEDKVWRSWENGPSKLFLNQLEYDFNARMIKHLRSIGVKVPIATTNYWGNSPISSLPALTAGDMIDIHSYQELGALEADSRIVDNSLHWIGVGQIANKPTTVTEWSWATAFTHDRHMHPIFTAAYASVQGWDALMQFAYTNSTLINITKAAQWETHNDPSAIAVLPAAALLFRQQDLAEYKNVYALKFDTETFFNRSINPMNSIAIRTAFQKGKLVTVLPESSVLPWVKNTMAPTNSSIITNPDQDLTSSLPNPPISSLSHDSEQGIMTINTDRAQVASGWIGKKTIQLKYVTFNVDNKHATVAVQSLDNQPINNSTNILISIGRYSKAFEMVKGKRIYQIEPIKGKLTIEGKKGLHVYKNGGLNTKKELEYTYHNNQYSIDLSSIENALWISISNN